IAVYRPRLVDLAGVLRLSVPAAAVRALEAALRRRARGRVLTEIPLAALAAQGRPSSAAPAAGAALRGRRRPGPSGVRRVGHPATGKAKRTGLCRLPPALPRFR